MASLNILADLSDIDVSFIYKINCVEGESRDVYSDYKTEKTLITKEEIDEYFKQYDL